MRSAILRAATNRSSLLARPLGLSSPSLAAARPALVQSMRWMSSVVEVPIPELGAESIVEGGILALSKGPGDYVAIQAYVDPEDGVVDALEDARTEIRDRFRVATTLGLGPRFLHSTGQLHKGGPPSGVFLQVVGDDPVDVAIPDRPFGFSTLKHAQAEGDLRTLRAHGLRAARIALSDLLEVTR